MGIRRTILAGVVLAAAIALYVADGRRAERAEIERLAATKLVPAPPESITRISIMSSGLPVELSREPTGWKITRPIRTDADPQAVEDLLFYLAAQTKTIVDDLRDEDLPGLGLLAPPITVLVSSGVGGPEISFAVGANSPAYGEVYARLAGEPSYFTVATELRDQLVRPLVGFRNRDLALFDLTESTEISLTEAGRTISLARADDGWAMTRPEAIKADGPTVASLLEKIQTTKIEDFIDTETLELARFGLDAPQIVAIFTRAGEGDAEDRATLLIGRRRIGEHPTYYATRRGSDQVFTLPQSLIDLMRAKPMHLRDRTIFTQAPADVGSFKLEFASRVTELRRDSSGRWQFADDALGRVDQVFAQSLIADVLRLRADRFLGFTATAEQTGLESPTIRIEIAGRGGTDIETLETGRVERVLTTGRVFARRGGPDGEVFLIRSEDSGSLMHLPEAFRDKSLFSFDRRLLAAIEIAVGDKSFRIEKVGESWIARHGPGRDAQVGPQAVDAFAAQMLGLRWRSALDKTVETDLLLIKRNGLEDPQQAFRLLGEGGQLLAELYQGGSDDRGVYVRRGDEDCFVISGPAYATLIRALGLIAPISTGP